MVVGRGGADGADGAVVGGAVKDNHARTSSKHRVSDLKQESEIDHRLNQEVPVRSFDYRLTLDGVREKFLS